MSSIKLESNASGTGIFTIASPNSNTNRTLTLPDATGTINTSGSANEVPAGSASTPSIYPAGDTNTGIFFPAADTIAFGEGGAEAMRIDSSGNVGIGTNSPATRVEIRKDSATSLSTYSDALRLTNGLNYGYGVGLDFAQPPSTGASIAVTGAISNDYDSDNNYSTRFYTMGSSTLAERARITSGGLMLLGLTSTLGANNGFLVTRGTASNFGILVGVETNGYNGIGFVNASNSVVGTITVNSGGTAYNTTSDYRLKENIAPMTGALATVAQLKPCTYTWKADGAAGQGFIAHELQAVVPDCVTGDKDATETYTDDNGVEQTRPKYQGVDTSYLVATLTSAIQELKAINDAQATRIETLETKVAALEAK